MYALNMTSLEHGDRVCDSALNYLASFLEDQDSAVVALVAD